MAEADESLVDVKAGVDRVPVLIDENLSTAGLLDVAEPGSHVGSAWGSGRGERAGRERRALLEDVVDGRQALDERLALTGPGRHRLRRKEKVLPAAAVERALRS